MFSIQSVCKSWLFVVLLFFFIPQNILADEKCIDKSVIDQIVGAVDLSSVLEEVTQRIKNEIFKSEPLIELPEETRCSNDRSSEFYLFHWINDILKKNRQQTFPPVTLNTNVEFIPKVAVEISNEDIIINANENKISEDLSKLILTECGVQSIIIEDIEVYLKKQLFEKFEKSITDFVNEFSKKHGIKVNLNFNLSQ